MSKHKKIRFIIHYVKPTTQLLFRIRFPKGGATDDIYDLGSISVAAVMATSVTCPILRCDATMFCECIFFNVPKRCNEVFYPWDVSSSCVYRNFKRSSGNIHFDLVINFPLRPSDAICHHGSWSTMAQVLFRLDSNKAKPAPILSYCQLNS